MNINKIIGYLLLCVSGGIAAVVFVMVGGLISGDWIPPHNHILIIWGILAILGLGVAAVTIGAFGVIGVQTAE